MLHTQKLLESNGYRMLTPAKVGRQNLKLSKTEDYTAMYIEYMHKGVQQTTNSSLCTIFEKEILCAYYYKEKINNFKKAKHILILI